jgi:tagatose 1,6-diphosphate aldolase
MTLTPGKLRRLQQAATPKGIFTVLAIDHRGPLKRRLGKECADVAAELRRVKEDIVRALAPRCSAALLDPEHGYEACVSSGALPGATGLLLALDTGSTGDPAILKTGLVEGWSPERVSRAGAAGVKLLVYYHPDSPEAAEVEQRVARVASECAAAEIPLYLEPLSYRPDNPAVPLESRERRRVVVESARRLVPLGVDVLKAEFPLVVSESPDQDEWRDACLELTEACPVPWVLLSAGVPLDVFLNQTLIACESGASGVIAGRAIWNEAVTADAAKRQGFLRDAAIERMDRVRAVCDSAARPYTEIYRSPSPLPSGPDAPSVTPTHGRA